MEGKATIRIGNSTHRVTRDLMILISHLASQAHEVDIVSFEQAMGIEIDRDELSNLAEFIESTLNQQ